MDSTLKMDVTTLVDSANRQSVCRNFNRDDVEATTSKYIPGRDEDCKETADGSNIESIFGLHSELVLDNTKVFFFYYNKII